MVNRDMDANRPAKLLFAALAGGAIFAAFCAFTYQTDGVSPGISSATVSLAAHELAPAADATAGASSARGSSVAGGPQAPGAELFARHCAACHGDQGDGQGLAARFLFPKPRDLRSGRFRLVSTDNNVPTREDLQAVLERGMPGSSMPPWAHLTQAERDALVDEVMRIRREGARENYVRSLIEQEGLTEEEVADAEVQAEIEGYVEDVTTPGDTTDVPTIGPPTEESVARGRDVYSKFACISCHGETGRGDGVQEMWDAELMPTRPRDFTRGIFKGDPQPESLYRRIAYGMPGTPMPGSSSMSPEQIVDLVHYIRSLSSEDQRQSAVLKRQEIVVQRVDAIPQSDAEESWSQIKAVPLRLVPLWWRDDAISELAVQAVHDGKTIAFRLSWQDATPDEHAVRSEAFEDAVALELYRGKAEPFLGMGSMAEPVDVWFWDADRQHGAQSAEQSYPDAVTDVYPFSEQVVSSAHLNRPGARMADQPDVSLPARASGNLIVPSDDGSGGTSLHVGGPGSVTFRVPQSQLVKAHGTWAGGRWTAVMTRSLAVASAADGVTLVPGERASIALAVWDGSQQDRDGQKSITIWHDLNIE